ncbi:hypothetical protein L1N85_21650, partial [Paenibacillus alkaliterrae]
HLIDAAGFTLCYGLQVCLPSSSVEVFIGLQPRPVCRKPLLWKKWRRHVTKFIILERNGTMDARWSISMKHWNGNSKNC